MKTGGNNPDKRQIWSLSYKTNFNCTPFFKSSSGWRTRELNPRGCRICFSLIALSGYLIRWQMTKTPPFTDKLSLSLSLLSFSLSLSLTHNAFSVFPHSHTHHAASLTLSYASSSPPFLHKSSHNWPFAKFWLVSSFSISHTAQITNWFTAQVLYIWKRKK